MNKAAAGLAGAALLVGAGLGTMHVVNKDKSTPVELYAVEIREQESLAASCTSGKLAEAMAHGDPDTQKVTEALCESVGVVVTSNE